MRFLRILRRFVSNGVPQGKPPSRKGLYAVSAAAVIGGVAIYRELNYLNHAVQYKVNGDSQNLDDEEADLFGRIKTNFEERLEIYKRRIRSLGLLFNEEAEEEPSWWSRLEVKSDNPWKLLTMAKSDVRNVRLQGVYGLSKKQNWLDAEYRKIAAALDDVTRVGLARSRHVDMRFFEGPREYTSSEESLEKSFRKLLSSLPMTGLDKCAQYFTAVAMQEGKTALADVRGGMWCFGGTGLPFATTLSNIPEQKVELYYLQALLRHSELPSHCDVIVQNGGVDLLQHLAEKRENSLTLLCKICRVIGNLCLHEHLHSEILKSEWVSLLASWMKSKYIPLSIHASRALANLDRDFSKEKYEHGVYVMHPQFRTSESAVADVIFVHGLLGGAFKTWRQQYPDTPPAEEAPQSMQSFRSRNQNITDCWPKSWLSEDIPYSRIITLEYDTQVSNWTPKCPFESEKRTISSRSAEMLNKLKLAGVGERPIIWVTHSMGGLLVKQMILDAENSKEFKSMADQSRGFVFYSTPHKGSPLAAYSQQAKILLYPSVEVEDLSTDSAALKEQHEKFRAFVRRRKLPCLSFGERDPTNIGLGMKLVIVPDASANPGFGDYKQLPTDHLNVCKPDNIDADLYQFLVCFLDELVPKRVITEITEVLDPNKATEEYYFGDMF